MESVAVWIKAFSYEPRRTWFETHLSQICFIWIFPLPQQHICKKDSEPLFSWSFKDRKILPIGKIHWQTNKNIYTVQTPTSFKLGQPACKARYVSITPRYRISHSVMIVLFIIYPMHNIYWGNPFYFQVVTSLPNLVCLLVCMSTYNINILNIEE